MVFLHFPTNLTEEEQMLRSKYVKLRKKKKALQLLKTPKPEPEKPIAQKRHAKDAKEAAKKLLLSGAIKVGNKEKQGFKRSKNFERKMSIEKATTSSVSGYQPFSQLHVDEESEQSPEPTTPISSGESSPFRAPSKSLYESFVSARDSESTIEKEPTSPLQQQQKQQQQQQRDGGGVGGAIAVVTTDGIEVKEKNTATTSTTASTNNNNNSNTTTTTTRQGNTIYVHGYGVTETILRNSFTSFGNIINISMETDKNCGFITFEKMEASDRAITEMNGSLVSSIHLKVSLARRQPVIEPNGENTSSNWATIASSHSQKGSHKDKRDLVRYEDDLF
ncbi:hypothetical protein CHUAL_006051 [Chamberlinius hualienensis]